MAKILPSVVIIFTILCLACALNALEDNLTSTNDDSPKDTADLASATSSKNPSSGRIIRPSAWSKAEEGELKQSDGRYTGNENQNLLSFDEQFGLLNIKKFFRYITSLLYAVEESNDESLKKITNNVIITMQNLTNNGLEEKSENNMNDEIQDFEKDNAPDKPAYGKQFQNSSTSGTPKKLSEGGKMQNLSNNGTLNGKQPAKTQKFETQKLAETQDNGEIQNSSSNNPTDKPSDDANAQESSNNKQTTVKPRLETQNSNDKDSTEISENNMKTQIQNFSSTDTQDDGEMQNSPVHNDANNPSNDENTEKSSHKDSFNNKQPTENSKQKTQNSNNKDSLDKSENNKKPKTQNLVGTDTQDIEEIQKAANNNTSDKLSRDKNAQNSLDNVSSNDKQPTTNPNLETQNSNDKDSTINSENNMKTETQNTDESNTLNKPATEEEIQNFSTNDSLNKSSDNVKMQNSSNNNSSISQQPTNNSKDSQQNSMNKGSFNKVMQDKKMRNPSNDNNQLKSISASKTNKLKEDLIEIELKDYDECKTDEITLDDNTTKYISEEKVEKYEDDDKEEEEDEDDTDENDVDENETKNDYINYGTDIKENNMKDSDVDDGNENDMNEKEFDDDNGNENNYDPGEKKNYTGNQNTQPAVIVQEKANQKPITLPKFIIQAIHDQQNYSETHSARNQFDNNDNVALESVKSQNITTKENPVSEFQLSSNEFIDDYINNQQRQNPQKENEKASNTEAFNPNGRAAMNKKYLLPNPILLNKDKKDDVPLNTAPSISETMKHQNMPFHQSQNSEDIFGSEKVTLPFPIFNENRKDSSHNQDFWHETFPQNVPYTFTSVDRPAFATQENLKTEEATPQKLIPFQQTPYFPNIQDTFASPQNDYNTFTQPAILGFQDTTSPFKIFHSDVPATNKYTPEIISSFQPLPNRPVPLQNEGYLNDQYGNYNFQDRKIPAINKENNQQFEQRQPTVLLPGMFSNTHYISNQYTPDELSKTTYFASNKPSIPEKASNENKPESNTEMFSNVLQPNPSFNQIYNEDSSPTGTENNMDKNVSQDHLDAIKPQIRTNNVQALNRKNQSEKLPLQGKFPGEQMLFPHNVKSIQQDEMNHGILPDKSKISTDKFSAQNETENTEFPLSQKNTKNSKEVPHHIFNTAEDNLQVKPEDHDSVPENIALKSSPQAKSRSSKPFNDEHQNSQVEDQEEIVSSSDSYTSKNEIGNDYLSENNYDSEEKTNKNEDQDEEEEENDDDDDDDDDDDYQIDDDYISDYDSDNNASENEDEEDYISEKNYDSDDNANEDEDEDEEEQEDENDHDETEINHESQNPQTSVFINDKAHGSTTISPNFVNQIKSDQQKHSETQPPTSHDNIYEAPKSQAITKKENPSSVSALSRDRFNNNNNNNRLGENLIKGKEPTPTSLSGGTVNDATMQITQNPTYSDTNDLTQSLEISKKESASSNLGGPFDTILEFIYKFPNNSLFKGIREEKN